MTNIELLSILTSLGNLVPLKYKFDSIAIAELFLSYQNLWQQYNANKPQINRKGLSLTSLDGSIAAEVDLTSLKEYAEKHNVTMSENLFNKKTRLYDELTIFHPLLNTYYPDLGRTHMIRLDAGGFFPPHRDGQSMNPDSFRIFVPLYNCEPGRFVFLIDNKVCEVELGRAYLLNARAEHALFSFTDNSTQLVLNIPLTEKNVEKTLNILGAR